VITPACGLAGYGASQAERVLGIARELAARVHDQRSQRVSPWEPDVETSSYRYCGVCGQPLEPGATVCGNCGAAVGRHGARAARATGEQTPEPAGRGGRGGEARRRRGAAGGGGRRRAVATAARRGRRRDVVGDAVADRRADRPRA
jgi:hypothetical protein